MVVKVKEMCHQQYDFIFIKMSERSSSPSTFFPPVSLSLTLLTITLFEKEVKEQSIQSNTNSELISMREATKAIHATSILPVGILLTLIICYYVSLLTFVLNNKPINSLFHISRPFFFLFLFLYLA